MPLAANRERTRESSTAPSGTRYGYGGLDRSGSARREQRHVGRVARPGFPHPALLRFDGDAVRTSGFGIPGRRRRSWRAARTARRPRASADRLGAAGEPVEHRDDAADVVPLGAHGLDRLDRRAAGGDDVLHDQAALARLERRALDPALEAVRLGVLAHEERLHVRAAGERGAGRRVGAHRQPADRGGLPLARVARRQLGQRGEARRAQDGALGVDVVLRRAPEVSVTSPMTSACSRSSAIRVSRAVIAAIPRRTGGPPVGCRRRGPRLRPRGVARPRRGGGAAARRRRDARARPSRERAPAAARRRGQARRLRGRWSRPPRRSSRDGPRAAAALGAVRERDARGGRDADRLRDPPRRRRSASRRTSPGERYQAIADSMRGASCAAPRPARCTSTSACPTRRRAIRACNGLRELPAGAAGRWRRTRPTGTAWTPASPRRPRAALPRLPARRSSRPRSPAGRTTWRSSRPRSEAGDAPDYTFLWWDIRRTRGSAPSRCGRWTRSRGRARRGLAALVHGLALAALDGRADALRPGRSRRELVPGRPRRARRRRCAGDGACARCASSRPTTLEPRPRRARRRGGVGALEEVERILREGNGADRCAPRTPRAGCAPCWRPRRRARLGGLRGAPGAAAPASGQHRDGDRRAARRSPAAPSSSRRRARASC